eukprot:scaffold2329_cov247-Pinguiococcus_pyrenoidosus.AAC.25
MACSPQFQVLSSQFSSFSSPVSLAYQVHQLTTNSATQQLGNSQSMNDLDQKCKISESVNHCLYSRWMHGASKRRRLI